METNPGQRSSVLAICRNLCSCTVLTVNLSDLTVAASQYDILFCSETLVSELLVSELLVDGFRRPALLCRGTMTRAKRWQHTCEMDMEHFANPNLCVAVDNCCFFMVCGVRQNFYVFNLYRKPKLDDPIFYCFSNINGCSAD